MTGNTLLPQKNYLTTSICFLLSEIAIAVINRIPLAILLHEGGTPAIVKPFATIVSVNAPTTVFNTLP